MSDADRFRKLVDDLKKLQTYGMVDDHYWRDENPEETTRLRSALGVLVTHRMRRGKLVEIPEQWRGKTVHEQTKRKRPSKARHKNKSGGKKP